MLMSIRASQRDLLAVLCIFMLAKTDYVWSSVGHDLHKPNVTRRCKALLNIEEEHIKSASCTLC